MSIELLLGSWQMAQCSSGTNCSGFHGIVGSPNVSSAIFGIGRVSDGIGYSERFDFIYFCVDEDLDS